METDTDSTRTTARRLLAALPALIDPGDPGWAYRMLLPLTLVAVLPVLILLASGALVTPRAVPEAAITPEIERAAERHAARRLDALSRATGPATLSDPPLSDGPYARLNFEAIARVDAVLKAQIGAARGRRRRRRTRFQVVSGAAFPDRRRPAGRLHRAADPDLSVPADPAVVEYRASRDVWSRIRPRHRRPVRSGAAALCGAGAGAAGVRRSVRRATAGRRHVDGRLRGRDGAGRPWADRRDRGAARAFRDAAARTGRGRRYWPELLHETTPAWMAGMAAVAAAPLAILAIRDLALPGGWGPTCLAPAGRAPGWSRRALSS
ncbi:MAG: hypothetical protein JKP98_12085 [Rhodobacteraceae bacterium]|nr:hypothetical protein [Paracoccaceae bacterium]